VFVSLFRAKSSLKHYIGLSGFQRDAKIN